jgi:UDP-N-acetylglucosamine/UDP-N-acetyl-alpha-D-glucosaminouronate 4-epimerase
MARVLVTGGAGFIGSHLVDALLARGDDVRVLDNFSTGDRRNLLHVAQHIEIVEGDLRSFERVLTAVRGCEIVFHEAALPSVPRSIQDPLSSSEVNVTGTLNVLLAARDAGVRRVVYASSSSVYGSTAPAEVKREDLPVAPLSPYGVAKFAGEAYCSSFHQVYGLETVSLRYFNVFGPRQSAISEYAAVIPNFFAAAFLEEPPVVYGDGQQSRDFTYVDNVVVANIAAAAAPGAAGEVFNVACGQTHSINTLLGHVARLVGRPLQPRYEPARPGEIRRSLADIEKARRLLGYAPDTRFEEGLERFHAHFSDDATLLPEIRERRRWLSLAR